MPESSPSSPSNSSMVHIYSAPHQPAEVNSFSTEPPPPPVVSNTTVSSNYFLKILQGEKKFRVLLISFLLGLIASILPTYRLFKVGMPFLNSVGPKLFDLVDEVYPEKLEINLKNGGATTNVTEPYYLSISQSSLQNLVPQETDGRLPRAKIRLLVIDTGGSVEDFEIHQSVAMLTARSLVYYSDGKINIQPLSSFPDMTISRQVIKDKLTEINQDNRAVKILRIIFYLSPLFIALGFWFWFLIEVFIGTLIAWLINKILMTEIAFTRLFRLVGLFTLGPVFFLAVALGLPGGKFISLWISELFDMLILAGVYTVIYRYRKEVVKTDKAS